VFLTRPISGVIMVFVVLALAFPLLRHLRERRCEHTAGIV
jgi:TctA family transporter